MLKKTNKNPSKQENLKNKKWSKEKEAILKWANEKYPSNTNQQLQNLFTIYPKIPPALFMQLDKEWPNKFSTNELEKSLSNECDLELTEQVTQYINSCNSSNSHRYYKIINWFSGELTFIKSTKGFADLNQVLAELQYKHKIFQSVRLLTIPTLYSIKNWKKIILIMALIKTIDFAKAKQINNQLIADEMDLNKINLITYKKPELFLTAIENMAAVKSKESEQNIKKSLDLYNKYPLEQATKILQEQNKEKPNFILLANIASIYKKQLDFKVAANYYEAIRKDYTIFDPVINLYLAECYINIGEYKKAKEILLLLEMLFELSFKYNPLYLDKTPADKHHDMKLVEEINYVVEYFSNTCNTFDYLTNEYFHIEIYEHSKDILNNNMLIYMAKTDLENNILFQNAEKVRPQHSELFKELNKLYKEAKKDADLLNSNDIINKYNNILSKIPQKDPYYNLQIEAVLHALAEKYFNVKNYHDCIKQIKYSFLLCHNQKKPSKIYDILNRSLFFLYKDDINRGYYFIWKHLATMTPANIWCEAYKNFINHLTYKKLKSFSPKYDDFEIIKEIWGKLDTYYAKIFIETFYLEIKYVNPPNLGKLIRVIKELSPDTILQKRQSSNIDTPSEKNFKTNSLQPSHYSDKNYFYFIITTIFVAITYLMSLFVERKFNNSKELVAARKKELKLEKQEKSKMKKEEIIKLVYKDFMNNLFGSNIKCEIKDNGLFFIITKSSSNKIRFNMAISDKNKFVIKLLNDKFKNEVKLTEDESTLKILFEHTTNKIDIEMQEAAKSLKEKINILESKEYSILSMFNELTIVAGKLKDQIKQLNDFKKNNLDIKYYLDEAVIKSFKLKIKDAIEKQNLNEKQIQTLSDNSTNYLNSIKELDNLIKLENEIGSDIDKKINEISARYDDYSLNNNDITDESDKQLNLIKQIVDKSKIEFTEETKKIPKKIESINDHINSCKLAEKNVTDEICGFSKKMKISPIRPSTGNNTGSSKSHRKKEDSPTKCEIKKSKNLNNDESLLELVKEKINQKEELDNKWHKEPITKKSKKIKNDRDGEKNDFSSTHFAELSEADKNIRFAYYFAGNLHELIINEECQLEEEEKIRITLINIILILEPLLSIEDKNIISNKLEADLREIRNILVYHFDKFLAENELLINCKKIFYSDQETCLVKLIDNYLYKQLTDYINKKTKQIVFNELNLDKNNSLINKINFVISKYEKENTENYQTEKNVDDDNQHKILHEQLIDKIFDELTKIKQFVNNYMNKKHSLTCGSQKGVMLGHVSLILFGHYARELLMIDCDTSKQEKSKQEVVLRKISKRELSKQEIYPPKTIENIKQKLAIEIPFRYREIEYLFNTKHISLLKILMALDGKCTVPQLLKELQITDWLQLGREIRNYSLHDSANQDERFADVIVFEKIDALTLYDIACAISEAECLNKESLSKIHINKKSVAKEHTKKSYNEKFFPKVLNNITEENKVIISQSTSLPKSEDRQTKKSDM